jgi:hypothetical protein
MSVYRESGARVSAEINLSIPRVRPGTYGVSEMAETFVEVDAQIVGPGSTDYQVSSYLSAYTEISNVFFTPAARRIHFQLESRIYDGVRQGRLPVATDLESDIRVTFRVGDRADHAIEVKAPIRLLSDGRIALRTGETTSLGGIYSGPYLGGGVILFGTDPVVHIGVTTDDPDRRQGTPERAYFRPIAFRTWLDARVSGVVKEAPRVRVAFGKVDVQYVGATWREARVVFDPRDKRGRLIVGSFELEVTWRVEQAASSDSDVTEFTATTQVRVSDDGEIVVGV